MPKFTIVEITDWERDEHEMAGDGCHMPESEILYRLAKETEEKVENNKWPGLPFTCETEDEDAALEKYRMKFCDGDYIVPIGADIEKVAYRVVWSNEHCADAFDAGDDLDSAKEEALNLLRAWMSQFMEEFHEDRAAAWDMMILNSEVGVYECDSEEAAWEPDDNDLSKIGWVVSDELDDDMKKTYLGKLEDKP